MAIEESTKARRMVDGLLAVVNPPWPVSQVCFGNDILKQQGVVAPLRKLHG
jgi:hypothetical protein